MPTSMKLLMKSTPPNTLASCKPLFPCPCRMVLHKQYCLLRAPTAFWHDFAQGHSCNATSGPCHIDGRPGPWGLIYVLSLSGVIKQTHGCGPFLSKLALSFLNSTTSGATSHFVTEARQGEMCLRTHRICKCMPQLAHFKIV